MVRNVSSANRITRSTRKKNVAKSVAITMTIAVVRPTSRRAGHTILAASARTCWMNWKGLVLAVGRSGFRVDDGHLCAHVWHCKPHAMAGPFRSTCCMTKRNASEAELGPCLSMVLLVCARFSH